MKALLAAAVALALVLVGCSSPDYSADFDRVNAELAAATAQLANVESALSALDAEVDALEGKLEELDEAYMVMSAPMPMPMATGTTIPEWLPGTTAEEAEEALGACLQARYTALLGPLGSALGADLLDLSEAFEGFPEAGLDVFGDEAFSIWLTGGMLGCWTGDLR